MKAAVVLCAILGHSVLGAPFDNYQYQNVYRLKKSPGPLIPYLDGGPNHAMFMGPQGTFREEQMGTDERGKRPYFNGGHIPSEAGPTSATYMDAPRDFREAMSIPERAGRSYYGGAGLGVGAGALGVGAAGLGVGGGGSGGLGVYSQFPGAGVGGYGIPLLMSCSPHIIPGHLVRGGYGYPGYKSAEDDNIMEPHDDIVERNFQT